MHRFASPVRGVAVLPLLLGWALIALGVAQAQDPGQTAPGGDLPGWRSAVTEPVSPLAARGVLARGLPVARWVEPMQVSALDEGVATTQSLDPQIVELARALGHDPDRVYQYVHDQIAFEPTYGAAKGALGTLLDRRGNSFDQAALMVALLNAGGTPARFVHGELRLTPEEISGLLGVAPNRDAVGWALGSGGIPAKIWRWQDDSLAAVDLVHVWVEAQIDGVWWTFDPALAMSRRGTGIDVATAIDYRASDLIDAVTADATTTPTAIGGLDRAALRSAMDGLTGSLINHLRTAHPAADIADILGDWSTESTANTPENPLRNDTHPDLNPEPQTELERWEAIPDTHRTRFRVRHLGIDVERFTDEIYGHRLSIGYRPDGFPELRLDGNLLAAGTAAAPPGTNGVILNIDHPYPTLIDHDNDPETPPQPSYQDQEAEQRIAAGGTYVIANAVGDMGRGMVEHHRSRLTEYRRLGLDESSEAVRGETLALLAANWIAQYSRYDDLSDALGNALIIHHHWGGIAGQSTSPYVDLPLNTVSPLSRELGYAGSLPEAAFYNSAGQGSAFEHGVIEQGQPFRAVSTVGLLDRAIAAGNTIHDLRSTQDLDDAAPGLTGYDTGELSSIRAQLAAGWRVLLPSNGDLGVDDWSGIGYLAVTAGRIGYVIRGGQALKGGEASSAGTVDSEAGREQGALPQTNVQNPTANDPIDMATGAFLYAHEDLRVGAGAPPFGLTLERSYSSAIRAGSGPFGPGWSHNFAVSASEDSDGLLGMGIDGTPVDAAAAIVAATVKLDLLQGEKTAERLLIAALIENWLMDRLTGNVVRIDQPGDGRRFVRLPDGSFNPPPGSADVLEQTDSGYRLSAKNGLVLDFETLLLQQGTGENPKRAFGLDTWTDRHGNRLAFTYDPDSKRLSRVATDLGRWLDFHYDGAGRIDRLSDHTARTVGYGYDADGNLTTYANSLNEAITYCWADGRLTALSAPGQALDCAAPQNPFLSNTYDSLGRVATQTNANGHTWTYRFAGTRSEEEDPLGQVRAWEYNDRGKVTRTIDALGQATSTDYDGQDRVIRMTRPEGDATSLDYDARHNPVRIVRHPKPGSPEALAGETLVASFSYEPLYSRIRSHTDTRGFTTDYVYDADADADLDRIEQPVVPRSTGGTVRPITRLVHNARGQLTQHTDPEGRVTRYGYDPDTAELTNTTRDPDGLALVTSLVYDTLGNVIATIDPRGNRSDLTYDSERRPTASVAPLGAETRIDYDTQGRPIATHRASGNPDRPWITETLAYTATGKVASRTDADGDTITTHYDALERQSRVTDPLGAISDYHYDAASRPIGVEQPAPLPGAARPSIAYSYHPNGTRAAVADQNGNTTAYHYDGFDRLIRTTYPDASQEVLGLDTAGNVETRTSRAGEVFAYSYDALGRLDQETRPDGRVFSYRYDRSGSLRTLTEGGDIWSWTYDAAGRPETATDPRLGTIGYGWDANGNQTALTWPDGYRLSTTHDALDRPETVQANGTLVASYGYDPLSRRRSLDYANATATTYAFEPDGDLTELTHRFANHSARFTFSYDAAGQRTGLSLSDPGFLWLPAASPSTDYSANALNQYSSVTGLIPAYDANGNLVSDGTRSFLYDPENRLIEVRLGTTVLASYRHDPQGRRSEQTVAGATTRFLYAGADVIGEYNDVGNLTKRYLPGPGLDEPIAFERPAPGGSGAPERFYYHADASGSVIALSDTGGHIAERYAYGPFGETTTASALGNPYRYTARRYEESTGIYHYRHRAYDPTLGRFLQPDPAGYADGLNLYAYVGNNPIAFVDPWGLGSSPGTWNLVTSYVVETVGWVLVAVDVANTVTGVLAGPDVGIGGAAMVTSARVARTVPRSGTTTLYRAVGPDELADIQKTGQFINRGSAEGKYFTSSAEHASDYAKQAVKAFRDPPYTTVKTQVPTSSLPSPVRVDGGIPAYVLPNQALPGLKPNVLNSMPIPR